MAPQMETCTKKNRPVFEAWQRVFDRTGILSSQFGLLWLYFSGGNFKNVFDGGLEARLGQGAHRHLRLGSHGDEKE